MYSSCFLLLCVLTSCYTVTINIHTGFLGPWRQIEVNNNRITSNIVKRGFVSKIFFEEDEEIDEDEQITSISKLAGLVEIEMKNIGQLKVPVFKQLNVIKSIKLNGNQITHIDDKSFSGITPKYIDLSNNHISQIDDDAFGDLLETLILKCNDLTTISSTWFQDTDSLQSLHLTGNKITVIPENFKVFNNLWEIHMSYNKINHIEDNALAQKQYTYIDISYNKLTELKPSSFSSKHVDIMYLNVRANLLNFLSNDFMKKSSITVEFTTDLNPWLCPCNELIRKWLPKIVLYNKNNSWLDAQVQDHAHRKEAHCVYNQFNSQECTEEIDEESTSFYFKEIEPFDTVACPE